ncbi:Rv2231c family pyridoxal phosphate-dependent protein CobC [Rhodococcus sp. HNM0569]|uniref:Rv2231c family pyridoxal phosphate-dependent protein CobC n=1 Tax=Rhodococcus sp. HNM0569 TaxID=2716340 RepID=UPI00146A5800|nr:threonine-phosphate decarboxylase [Rhodococcus sp. HNM0569]
MGISPIDRAALRHHGDVDVAPDVADFAVNVQGAGPPGWLRDRLAAALDSLGRYPATAHDAAARAAVARRHGRDPDDVLLLSGGAEGFSLLPNLRPTLAAVVHPSFTEPEFALREAGVPTVRVVLDAPWSLAAADVPEQADLVVLGNPTNPTSVLHHVRDIDALRRPGRLVVVDEAFMDAVPGEPESFAHAPAPDVLVLRSLTKTWALAGLRCGYALGDSAVLARLSHGRPHWPLGTLQLEAIAACSEPDAVARARRQADTLAASRVSMTARLRGLGLTVHEPAAAPFVLVHVPGGDRVRGALAGRDVVVRRCDTFPGLGPDFLRMAVRPARDVDTLIEALAHVL